MQSIHASRLVAAAQPGLAALGAVELGAAHPFAEVLDQHGLGVRQVGRVHRADGGRLRPRVHRAVEGVDQTNHLLVATQALVVRIEIHAALIATAVPACATRADARVISVAARVRRIARCALRCDDAKPRFVGFQTISTPRPNRRRKAASPMKTRT
jgi:hypothetical protein